MCRLYIVAVSLVVKSNVAMGCHGDDKCSSQASDSSRLYTPMKPAGDRSRRVTVFAVFLSGYRDRPHAVVRFLKQSSAGAQKMITRPV